MRLQPSRTSIFQSFHSSKLPFFCNRRSGLQPKLGILNGFQDLSKTSSLLIFQEHNHLISKNCSNMNSTNGLNPDSLQWEIGPLPIRCKCDIPSKRLVKVFKFTSKHFSDKPLKPLVTQKPCRPVSQPFTSSMQPHHLLNAFRHCLSF